MSNYLSFKARIAAAATVRDVERLDESLCRLLRAGVFTVSEFQCLDALLCDKLSKVSEAP